MATDWKDNYAQCPFFLRSEDRKIVCDGNAIYEKLKIPLNFYKQCHKVTQMQVFCCGKFVNCNGAPSVAITS